MEYVSSLEGKPSQENRIYQDLCLKKLKDELLCRKQDFLTLRYTVSTIFEDAISSNSVNKTIQDLCSVDVANNICFCHLLRPSAKKEFNLQEIVSQPCSFLSPQYSALWTGILGFSWIFTVDDHGTKYRIPKDPGMSSERDYPYNPILRMGLEPSILLEEWVWILREYSTYSTG